MRILLSGESLNEGRRATAPERWNAHRLCSHSFCAKLLRWQKVLKNSSVRHSSRSPA